MDYGQLTQGPWEAIVTQDGKRELIVQVIDTGEGRIVCEGNWSNPYDQTFMAQARTENPELQDKIKEQAERIASLELLVEKQREALKKISYLALNRKAITNNENDDKSYADIAKKALSLTPEPSILPRLEKVRELLIKMVGPRPCVDCGNVHKPQPYPFKASKKDKHKNWAPFWHDPKDGHPLRRERIDYLEVAEQALQSLNEILGER